MGDNCEHGNDVRYGCKHCDDAGTEPPLARGRMTDLPDAVVDAAVEAMKRIVPNEDGVLWEFDDVIDQRTGMTQPHPVTLHDAARAALAAASGPWAEQLDAANTTHSEKQNALNNRCQRVEKANERLRAERDAALARNAELKRDLGQWKDRMWVSVRERAVWSHEAGEHAGDVPFLNCPLCESSALRAELDNLRETLAQKVEAEMRRLQTGSEAPEFDEGMAVAAALVRGSDDE